MARNAEKAMTTLARWRTAQLEEDKPYKKRRPFLASECNDLRDAEKWRLDIIRQISKKVTQIQNAGLGEFRIRDLNDQINKLLREKRHWEMRIHELGGVNFRKAPGPKFDSTGKEVPGSRGYKYFGAAKDLPGVRELFGEVVPSYARKTRPELMRDIDDEYYGYRDEDDGIILEAEMKAQRQAQSKMMADSSPVAGPSEVTTSSSSEDEGSDFVGPKRFVSHVPFVPTQQQVQEQLLQRRKRELMDKYVSESLSQSEQESKQLLGT